jgi:hypothetical protein
MRQSLKLFALCGALAASGCATIVSHSTWPVQVSSTPDGATVEIANKAGTVVHRATTPCVVMLSSYGGYFAGERYAIRCAKDGAAGEAMLTTDMNWWYLGNVLFGGLTGILVIDPLTGAMWKLPSEVHVDLAGPTN